MFDERKEEKDQLDLEKSVIKTIYTDEVPQLTFNGWREGGFYDQS